MGWVKHSDGSTISRRGGVDLPVGRRWLSRRLRFKKFCMSKRKNLDPWGSMRRTGPLDPPMKHSQFYLDFRQSISCQNMNLCGFCVHHLIRNTILDCLDTTHPFYMSAELSSKVVNRKILRKCVSWGSIGKALYLYSLLFYWKWKLVILVWMFWVTSCNSTNCL